MDTNTIDPADKTLILYEPDKEVSDMYFNYFLERFNTELMRSMMMSGFHSILMNWDVKVESGFPDSHSNTIVAKYKESNGALKKNMLAAILAVFVSDIRNMILYMNTLSEDVRKVMELVACNHIVSHATLEKETGRSWLVKSTVKYGPSFKITPELVWIECTHGRCEKTTEASPYESEYYFYMDKKFRPLFMPFVTPKDRLTTTLSVNLPDPKVDPLVVFNAEKDIFKEIPILDGLYRQGSFCLTGHRKFPVKVMKKLATQMKMREFYPDGNKKLMYLRSTMVMTFYHKFMCRNNKITNHPESVIKEVFQQNLLVEPAFLLSTVLPHITGFKSLPVRNAFGHNDILEFCGFMFDRVKSNKDAWIDFEQLLNSMMLAGDSVSLFSYYLLGDMPLMNNFQNYPIYLDNTFEEISVSFFKGFLFLMAAFGLIEIAHKPFDEHDPSPFSSLRYFRLTDLGLYAFGFISSYTQPEFEDKELYFKLDENNLIACSLIDNNPYEPLLAGMSEPIGNRRYKISATSMLKTCNEQKEIVNKIEFFKRYICENLPPLWEDFFSKLVQQSEPLKELRGYNHRIFQLDPANEELMHLIATDPQIRKHARRVEGYLLLVEAYAVKEVNSRLKNFGYLL